MKKRKTSDLLIPKDSPIPIRPYVLQEIAKIYGVDRKTLRRWLRPFTLKIGIRIGNYYSVKQVRLIFHLLGDPDNSPDE